MDALARLAGGVAHDFNNFLMAIMGYTEMLASRMSATEEPCQEIEDIRALCRDATTLTQQLLTFGRRQVRQLAVLDVNQIVAELEGSAAPGSRRRLTVDRSSSRPSPRWSARIGGDSSRSSWPWPPGHGMPCRAAAR